jgi:SPP1 family predicted phage head-tail adaptor
VTKKPKFKGSTGYDFPHRIRIEQGTQIQGDDGTSTTTWAYLTTSYASFEPVTGQWYMKIIGQAGLELVTHNIKMRYVPDIAIGQRIVWGDRIFEITGFANRREENRVIEILGSEQ